MISFTDTVQIYRAATTQDAYGTTQAMAVVQSPTGRSVRPDMNWSGDQQSAGGEMQGAKRRWFLRSDVAAQERDVMVVTVGPNAPKQLRIVSLFPAMHRNGAVHHYEANVETYVGAL